MRTQLGALAAIAALVAVVGAFGLLAGAGEEGQVSAPSTPVPSNATMPATSDETPTATPPRLRAAGRVVLIYAVRHVPNPYPAVLPASVDDSLLRVYANGVAIVRDPHGGAGYGPAGDRFRRVQLTAQALDELVRRVAVDGRFFDQPAGFLTCHHCPQPSVFFDDGRGGSAWVTGSEAPGTSDPNPHDAALRGLLEYLAGFAASLSPADVDGETPYSSDAIWVRAEQFAPGGPAATTWPSEFGWLTDYQQARLVCGEASGTLRGFLDHAGDRWTSVLSETGRWAVRYRPAFPDEEPWCTGRADAGSFRHAANATDVLLRFDSSSERHAGPVLGDYFPRAVLYGDGTLLLDADHIGGGAGTELLRLQLSESGIQRLLRMAVIEGRAFSQPGPPGETAEICADCPRHRVRVTAGEHSRSFELAWRQPGAPVDALPARAERLVAAFDNLSERAFAAREVIDSGSYAPPAVVFRTFSWGRTAAGRATPWPDTMPALESILDDERHVVCGDAAGDLVKALRPLEFPVLHDGPLYVWVTAWPMLPHEYAPELCGSVWADGGG